MKDIKKYPEDAIDTLKKKKKKDVLSTVKLGTSVALGSTPDEKEQARLKKRHTNWILFIKKGMLASGIQPLILI